MTNPNVSNEADAARAGASSRWLEVFATFLKLGLTSFGGPIAHIGYFHRELVTRRRWVDDEQYAQLVALGQFLPGPASSQVGFSLGLLRAGWPGGVAAFVAFTLPSVLLLLAFARAMPLLEHPHGQAAIHGLKLLAVAVVAQGVLTMAERLTPDLRRRVIAVAAAAVLIIASTAMAQLIVIVGGACAGLMFCRSSSIPDTASLQPAYGRRAGLILISLFAVLLAASIVLSSGMSPLWSVAAAFYRTGSLVFGGGHVVLPLLQESVVDPGWVRSDDFLAGYGAAQAVPGPMFSLAAFLGARTDAIGDLPGATMSLLAIFAPGLLLMAGMLPLWHSIARAEKAAKAIAGVNAAVVGLLAAALYDPVWTSAVYEWTDIVIVVAAFIVLTVTRTPVLAVVAGCVIASMAVYAQPDESLARSLTIGPAYSGSSVNVVANRRHALFTHDRIQFAAYYDDDRHLVLARRSLDSDEWIAQRTSFTGNVKDAHNSISIAVDSAGILHVAWDQHDNPLNYARGVRPLELELIRVSEMTGVAEQRVSYPEFHRLAAGDLLFLYRDGQSGRGRLVLNRYSVSEGAWRTVQSNLIDGAGERSPYWNLAVDRSGGVHLAWLWRDTPDVATNHDLAYAFSGDAGVTWRSAEGAALDMPITVAADAYVTKIPTRHNLMNPPWITTDAHGRPYIMSYWSDAPNSPAQFRVVHRSEGAWRTETITQRTETFALAGTGTRRPPISRGVLVVEDSEHAPAAHLVYRDDALGGAVLMSTDRLGSGEWRQRMLTQGSPDAWEPSIDPVQWQRFQQLHLLMQTARQRDGNDAEDANTDAADIATLIVDPRRD